MIYTKATKKAMKIAYEKHINQTDKSGIPYIYHPIHLAEQMDDEESTIVALLHDVVEDTNTSLDELKEMGFSTDVIDALKLLTHDKNDDYFQYINKITKNNIAKKVKIADLKHNSDITRLDVTDEKALKRIEKYRKSLEILEKN